MARRVGGVVEQRALGGKGLIKAIPGRARLLPEAFENYFQERP